MIKLPRFAYEYTNYKKNEIRSKANEILQSYQRKV